MHACMYVCKHVCMYACMYTYIYQTLLDMCSGTCTGIIYTWLHWHLQMLREEYEWNWRCLHVVVLKAQAKSLIPQNAQGESSRQVRQNVYIAFHALVQQGHIGPQIQHSVRIHYLTDAVLVHFKQTLYRLLTTNPHLHTTPHLLYWTRARGKHSAQEYS